MRRAGGLELRAAERSPERGRRLDAGESRPTDLKVELDSTAFRVSPLRAWNLLQGLVAEHDGGRKLPAELPEALRERA